MSSRTGLPRGAALVGARPVSAARFVDELASNSIDRRYMNTPDIGIAVQANRACTDAVLEHTARMIDAGTFPASSSAGLLGFAALT